MSEYLQKKFHQLQLDLVAHKYRYYVLSKPTISDTHYDALEQESLALAKKLGYQADTWEMPEENEKHHVHWMIGFNDKNPYAIELGLKRATTDQEDLLENHNI